MRLTAILGALLLSLTSASAAPLRAPPSVVDDPFAAVIEQATDEGLESHQGEYAQLYRITRDYNLDGRPDFAFAFLEECGAGSFSTGCLYALFIGRADGRFTYVGDIAGHGELARLAPAGDNSAVLLNCETTREGREYLAPARISNTEISWLPERDLTDKEYMAQCADHSGGVGPRDYVWEQCFLPNFFRDHRCDWSPVP